MEKDLLERPWQELLNDSWVNWNDVVRRGILCSAGFLEALGMIKVGVLVHMNLLVETVMKVRAKAMEEQIRDIRVVVSTVDAWAKYKAGCVKGVIGRLLDNLSLKLALVDEMEAYHIEQMVAAAGCGPRSFETMVFFGDEHQRLENFKHNPLATRLPWVSTVFQSEDKGLELSSACASESWNRVTRDFDERDMDDADAQNDQLSGQQRVTETTNWPKRPFHDFLRNVPKMELNYCKRCGPQVCSFVQNAFPSFAGNFKSDEFAAPNTLFWHVFYDGEQWEKSPIEAREDARPADRASRNDDMPLGWHTGMFGALLAMCMEDVAWVARSQNFEKKPKLLIICPLSRVGVPLHVICSILWPEGDVQVLLAANVRGLSVPVVHVLRHRRRLHVADQYNGLQSDPAGEYLCMTRGQHKTVMWVEKQPLGLPSWRSPSVHVQRMLPSGISAYAVRRNYLLNSNKWWWFELKPVKSEKPWPTRYNECFSWARLSDVEERTIENAFHAAKQPLGDTNSPLPSLARPVHYHHDFMVLLQELLAGEQPVLADLSFASTQDVRQVGISKAQQNVMPEGPELERWLEPEDKKYPGLALGFGMVAMPAPVVMLSARPDAGMAQVCLPILSLHELGPWLSEAPGKAAEDILESLGLLVFGLAARLRPNKIEGLFLQRSWHKAETKVDREWQFWFNKACKSNRVALVIIDPSKKAAGKNNKWYAYLDGGALDNEQSDLLSGFVVKVKDWEWAALTVLAAWVLTCCCPAGPPAWISPSRVVSNLEEDDALEEEVHPEPSASSSKEVQFTEKCHNLCLELLAGVLPRSWPVQNPAEWPIDLGGLVSGDGDHLSRAVFGVVPKVAAERVFPQYEAESCGHLNLAPSAAYLNLT